jgi:hypothetical protein
VICEVELTTPIDPIASVVAGDRERCGSEPAQGIIDESIDATLAETQHHHLSNFVIPLPPADLPRSSTRNAEVIEHYVSDEGFRRFVLPDLVRELETRGLRCVDCPTLQAWPDMKITEKQVSENLLA